MSNDNSSDAPAISGLHHVTAVASSAQQNLDFYAGVLGLRLVKKTVNFDAPGTYHLYYADAEGRPGSVLTFFPFEGARAGRTGTGMATATAFSVPAGALDGWVEHLTEGGHDFEAPVERFGAPVLRLEDPDGLPLELVAQDPGEDAPATQASEGAIRSFHSVTLRSAAPDDTARLLTEVFGWVADGEEGGRLRLRAPSEGRASVVDVLTGGAEERARGGRGTVHHVAFRVAGEAEQQAWREKLLAAGLRPTPVKDRQYFKSIYFREPGGVLFEIATDPPGFHIDEPDEALGTALKLPAWLESQRAQIEARLPALHPPSAREQ